ncbi:MAG: IS66 family insertion sequence element accessory protein TnpB [Tissierellia bacterium]|nr:IS66 family insertion sequence element accessory protein TnpB [Tissierellia bacterium]
MDIVSETKAEFRLRQWTKIIQECQASDLTITAWCKENNVGIKSYYYWLRKIRLKACQSMECQSPAMKQEIVPLQLNPQQCTSSVQPAVTIHFGAASIDIAEGTSQKTIEAVLRSLQSIC